MPYRTKRNLFIFFIAVALSFAALQEPYINKAIGLVTSTVLYLLLYSLMHKEIESLKAIVSVKTEKHDKRRQRNRHPAFYDLSLFQLTPRIIGFGIVFVFGVYLACSSEAPFSSGSRNSEMARVFVSVFGMEIFALLSNIMALWIVITGIEIRVDHHHRKKNT